MILPKLHSLRIRAVSELVIVVSVQQATGCVPDRGSESLLASGHAGATVHPPWWCGLLCSSASELAAGSPALWSGEHRAFEL